MARSKAKVSDYGHTAPVFPDPVQILKEKQALLTAMTPQVAEAQKLIDQRQALLAEIEGIKRDIARNRARMMQEFVEANFDTLLALSHHTCAFPDDSMEFEARREYCPRCQLLALKKNEGGWGVVFQLTVRPE